MSRLGPGIVSGAADDDPSGIGTYTQVGAAFGTQLLWLSWAILPLVLAVQQTAGRLGLSTGKGLATLLRERLPRRVVLAAVTLLAAANIANIGADLGSMGASLALIVPLPAGVLMVVSTVVILGLEVLIPYHRYARFLRLLTLSLVSYLLVLASVHVDWSQVGRDLLPSMPSGRAAIAAVIALMGTTISPYLFFWQAAEEVEERRTLPLAQVRAKMRDLRLDVATGMLAAVVVMFAIIVATASTLHRQGLATVQTAEQAAVALEPLAGRSAKVLFCLGVFGTGMLAVPILAGSVAYAVAEMFDWPEGLEERFSQARAFYGVIIVAVLLGLALNLAGVGAMRFLYVSAILNGVAAPPLLALMIVIDRPDRVPLRGSRWASTGMVVAMLVMAALPVWYLLG